MTVAVYSGVDGVVDGYRVFGFGSVLGVDSRWVYKPLGIGLGMMSEFRFFLFTPGPWNLDCGV